MKRAGILLAATVAAATSSSVIFSSGHDSRTASNARNEGSSPPISKDGGSGSVGGAGSDKFAPRFDGLRFIETLVTAHR